MPEKLKFSHFTNKSGGYTLARRSCTYPISTIIYFLHVRGYQRATTEDVSNGVFTNTTTEGVSKGVVWHAEEHERF